MLQTEEWHITTDCHALEMTVVPQEYIYIYCGERHHLSTYELLVSYDWFSGDIF